MQNINKVQTYDFLKNVFTKIEFEGEDDNIFIDEFIYENYATTEILEKKIINKNQHAIEFITLYYYYIQDKNNLTDISDIWDYYEGDEINFYAILKNKSQKLKFTLNDWRDVTLLNVSIGVILSYFEKYKKSLKKSVKAHLFLIKYMRNSIRKFIKFNNYVFILVGINKRIFKLINFFKFCKKKTFLEYYVIKPINTYKNFVFKKIKSIKRKLQKKNQLKTKIINKNLKKISSIYYKI